MSRNALSSAKMKRQEEGEADDIRIKIGSFNLNYLALPDDKTYTQAEYAKKIAWCSNQLEKMDADIVGFQEVIHEEALQAVIKATPCYQRSPPHVVVGSGSMHRIALLSRFRIVTSSSISDFPEESLIEGDCDPGIQHFQRPVLRARIELPNGLPIIVFVTHLKSQRPIVNRTSRSSTISPFLQRAIGQARALIRRTAEAVALRAVLLEELETSSDPVVLIGDLNDAAESTTTELVAGTEPSRKLAKQERMAIWDTLLSNAKDIQARQSMRDVYFTFIYNGHYESLDHIFVSSDFARRNPDHIGYVEYVRVFADHLIDETISSEELPKWMSDHGQPLATIKLSRAAKDAHLSRSGSLRRPAAGPV
eukprot:TRINITY_DN15126_c0_g1_i1.p1 TRINITY_DN15126_c0_g1~~TRINITY_DN15126_c0_g1_i1.p1  ORF type:complete len:365 (+),score=54.93 TRINITY_DN15126_c0_g1_i1:24-1118(+)